MPAIELAIDGTFYTGGMLVKTTVGISEGRIVEIRKGLQAERREEVKEGIIVPGAIDMHVHMRVPGMEHKETVETGTLSAAFGGVTTIFDMPNTLPPTTTPERARAKLKLYSGKSYTDFGVYGALVRGVNVRALSKLVPAFKLYMASTTGELVCQRKEEQLRLIKEVAKTGRLVVVHAEDEGSRNRMVEKNLRDHFRARPPTCEIKAVQDIADIISSTQGARVHIAHATLRETVEMKNMGKFTVEVTPHHLFLDMDMPLGAYGKVNPPLRRREDRIALMKLVKEDAVDTIGSDHAPHTKEEKGDDFDYAPAGVPGVETSLPLMMHEVASGSIKLSTVVRMFSETPASMMRLKKGRIEIGYDADLAVFNLKRVTEIKGEKLHSKCGWTPFEDFRGIFPEAVFLRGEKIISNGEATAKPSGRQVEFSDV